MKDLLASVLKLTTPVQLTGLAVFVLWLLARLLLSSPSRQALTKAHRHDAVTRIINWVGVVAIGGLVVWTIFIVAPLIFREPPRAAADRPVPAPVVTPAPIDLSTLKQATYRLDGERISLTDGKLEFDPPSEVPNASLYPIYVYLTDTAFGDLTGTGVISGAAILQKSDGGSGIYYYLVPVTRQNNGVVSDAEGIDLGDRLQFKRFEVTPGHVFIDALMHREDDPGGQPSIVRHLDFAYSDGALNCATLPCSELDQITPKFVPLTSPTATASLPVAGSDASPSFDCEKARFDDEFGICANPELSRLDRKMGIAYKANMSRVNAADHASLVDVQRSWIVERRHRCGGSVACLRDYLQLRLDQLGNG
jgi:uncharacterized protein YecT (DUF1311 family)